MPHCLVIRLNSDNSDTYAHRSDTSTDEETFESLVAEIGPDDGDVLETFRVLCDDPGEARLLPNNVLRRLLWKHYFKGGELHPLR